MNIIKNTIKTHLVDILIDHAFKQTMNALKIYDQNTNATLTIFTQYQDLWASIQIDYDYFKQHIKGNYINLSMKMIIKENFYTLEINDPYIELESIRVTVKQIDSSKDRFENLVNALKEHRPQYYDMHKDRIRKYNINI
jgi:hypothetical protein